MKINLFRFPGGISLKTNSEPKNNNTLGKVGTALFFVLNSHKMSIQLARSAHSHQYIAPSFLSLSLYCLQARLIFLRLPLFHEMLF